MSISDKIWDTKDPSVKKVFFKKKLQVSETEGQLLSFRYKVEALIF